MSEWLTYTVEDLVKLGVLERPLDGNHGSIHPKTGDFVQSGIPFVMASDLKDGRIDFESCAHISEEQARNLRKGFSKPGDVLLSHKATIGRTAIVQDNKYPFIMLTPQVTYYRVKDSKHLSNRYLKYYFDSRSFKEIFETWAGAGSTRAYLGIKAQGKLPIVLPSIDFQERIVETIAPLDDKIELNRRMNETLEAMARAIFKDWFVDFGPVRAKAEGRPPPGLSPDIAALFPDALDDDDKPVGWRRESLGDHMVNFDRKRVPVSGSERAKHQGPYPYHGATGVMDHVDDYLFDGIYLLVGEDGSVVKESGLAFTQYVWGKIWVNNHAHVLQGKGSVSTEQLLMYFQHVPVTPYITGAVQLKLSQGRMNSMPFVYAGDRVCQSFLDVVAPLFTRLRANSDENKTLAQLRDLLLPKLMSGEIRLREAEKTVEAVA